MLTRLIQWLTTQCESSLRPEPVETFSFSLSEFEKEIESNPELKAAAIALAERLERQQRLEDNKAPFDGIPF